jgi:uncharacterized repeat protein (TIGR01451 family)
MMSWFPRHVAAVLVFCAALTSAALAAAPNVALTLSGVALVRQSDGSFKEAALSDVTLKAGDKVRYSVVAFNKGDAPAVALVPSDPVPARMEYVGNSATTAGGTPEFTLDGKTWSAHPTVVVKTPKGPVTKPAPLSDYKAIRWVMTTPLPPKASAKFAFEARVK